MIAVVANTGGTNLSSVCHALHRLQVDYRVTGDPAQIKAADKVVLPGVGAARPAMERLNQAGMVEILRSLNQPVLGICLGMQLLFDHSSEGDTVCLGIIPGRVTPISRPTSRLRIPHMGWNNLIWQRPGHALAQGLDEQAYVYYVHSFVAPSGPWVKAHSEYGQPVPAVVQQDNFYGCQFHPEKSSRTGTTILHNFLNLGSSKTLC